MSTLAAALLVLIASIGSWKLCLHVCRRKIEADMYWQARREVAAEIRNCALYFSRGTPEHVAIEAIAHEVKGDGPVQGAMLKARYCEIFERRGM